MKPISHIYLSEGVKHSECFADGGKVRRLYRWVKLKACRLISHSGHLCNFIGLVRGRSPLEADASRVVKELAGHSISNTERKVYQLSENPDRQLEGHLFFSQIIQDCRLVGAGLVPCIDEYLVSQAVEVGNNNVTEFATAETRPLKNRSATVLKGKYASLCSHWSHWKGYYHWLLDILPTLSLIEPDRKILVNSPLSDYERESLRLMGVLDRCVEVETDHMIVEDFQFVSPSSSSGVYNPFAVKFVRGSILSGLLERHQGIAPNKDKVYLSRVGERRAARNEAGIVDFLEARGWKILEAHKLSFEEQVLLVHNAQVIMGVHGANLTNILWGRKGRLKVVEFIASNRPVPTNENIALSLDFEYHAIICQSFRDGCVDVDIKLLENVLQVLDDE